MKLKPKIIISNMAIVMTTLAAIFTVIFIIVDEANIHNVYLSLLERSDFINTYISQDLNNAADEEYLNSVDGRKTLETTLQQFTGCKVVVTSKSPKQPDEMQKFALTGQKYYMITDSQPNRILRLAFPIMLQSRVAGSVEINYPLIAADEVRKKLLYTLIISGLCGFSFSLVLSFIFSSRLLFPLKLLDMRTKEISQGDFCKTIEIKTKDELGTLSQSVNSMSQDINNMVKQLKDEHKKQKSFIDNVTHELRTPLTNIIGFADIVNETNEKLQRTGYIEKIKGEGQRLLNMVNQLLDLSRLGQYEESYEFELQDLDTLIAEVQKTMEPRLTTFGILLNLSLQKVSAKVDANKIKQVLINLIDNAIKYSEGDNIEISLYKEQNNIFINISDNGIGIKKEHLEKITEPFYRIDKTRSRRTGGTGLGLSICNQIIKKHGGEIIIHSEENFGTIVSIKLV